MAKGGFDCDYSVSPNEETASEWKLGSWYVNSHHCIPPHLFLAPTDYIASVKGGCTQHAYVVLAPSDP